MESLASPVNAPVLARLPSPPGGDGAHAGAVAQFSTAALNGAEPRLDELRQVDAAMLDTLRQSGHGPLVQICEEHLASGGKHFRARLVLATARSLEAPVGAAIPFAAACELMHNASLIHDDLQDGDAMRRGRPAIWRRFGAAQAINAGDLLLMLSYRALDAEQYSPSLRAALSNTVARRAALTVCGQALELEGKKASLTWALYDEACLGKTGQFFALPVEGAALVAGRSEARAAELGNAVLRLGLVYQLRDDVQDLFGDKGRGERGNDLREGKWSALFVALCERAPAWRARLSSILTTSRAATTQDDVEAVASAVLRTGALDDVVGRMRLETLALASDRVWGEDERLRHAICTLATGWLAEVASLMHHPR